MRTDAAAGKDRSILGLDSPDHHIGVGGFQGLADARQRATRANAGAKAVDRAVHLLQDLAGGGASMYHRVIGILKLLGHPHVGVLLRHLQRGLQAGVDAFADIAVIVHQNQLCPIGVHQLAALFADGIRHNDAYAIAAHSTDQRKADTLVAAGGLHNDCILADHTTALCFTDHIIGRTGLDRATDIDTLIFHKHLGRALRHDACKTDHRRVADRF